MVPHSLADLLFRLAEHPSLYQPRWTDDVLDGVHRNHIEKDRSRAENIAFFNKIVPRFARHIAAESDITL